MKVRRSIIAVYVLEYADASEGEQKYYIGMTHNLSQRLHTHIEGTLTVPILNERGIRRLAYVHECESVEQAKRIEDLFWMRQKRGRYMPPNVICCYREVRRLSLKEWHELPSIK